MRKVLGHTVEQLNQIAGQAVSRAVSEHHKRGIPTYHIEGGKVIKTAPNGDESVVDVKTPKAATRAAA